MAKKENLLKKQLLKGNTIKKKVLETDKIEDITQKVYEKAPSKKEEKEAVQRTTLDIPKSIHLAAKMEAMKSGVTLKEFIVQLIQKELENRKSK